MVHDNKVVSYVLATVSKTSITVKPMRCRRPPCTRNIRRAVADSPSP